MNGIKTKYPIIILTGFNNCDKKLEKAAQPMLNVFGSLCPKVSLGYTDAFGTVDGNVRQAEITIKKVLAETGCEKVNIIGFSRGGFDARRAATLLGKNMIASVTIVASPHHGSPVLEQYLDGSFKSKFLLLMLNLMRYSYHEKGNPVQALSPCTIKNVEAFNRENPNVDGIYYKSIGFVMTNEDSDKSLKKEFRKLTEECGENDGIVPLSSAKWDNFKVYRSNGPLGISHYQMMDVSLPLTDANGNGDFETLKDVYVDIVKDLIEAGV